MERFYISAKFCIAVLGCDLHGIITRPSCTGRSSLFELLLMWLLQLYSHGSILSSLASVVNAPNRGSTHEHCSTFARQLSNEVWRAAATRRFNSRFPPKLSHRVMSIDANESHTRLSFPVPPSPLPAPSSYDRDPASHSMPPSLSCACIPSPSSLLPVPPSIHMGKHSLSFPNSNSTDNSSASFDHA